MIQLNQKMSTRMLDSEDMDNFLKQKLEKEFNEMLEKGEDVRHFLYFPSEMLSERIKVYLEEFLCEEAWKEIEKGHVTKENFVMYKDDLITISFDEKHHQLEMLDRLISYFSEKEQYEKCAIIKEILNTII